MRISKSCYAITQENEYKLDALASREKVTVSVFLNHLISTEYEKVKSLNEVKLGAKGQ